MDSPRDGGRIPAAVRLRLAVSGARSSRVRGVVTVLVAGVASIVLLVGAAALPTAQARMDRLARTLPAAYVTSSEAEGLLMRVRTDYYGDRVVKVTDLAPLGRSAVLPPGVGRMPGPGEMVVSPALAELLLDSEVRRRYPERVVGEMTGEGLVGPRALAVFRGTSAAELAGERIVVGFGWPGLDGTGVPSEMRVGVPFMVVCFLIPLLALIGVIASLGSRRRSERSASLRLLGLRRRDVRALHASESGLFVGLGYLLAVATALLTLPWLAPRLPISGGLWLDDIRLDVGVVALLGLVVTALAFGCSWLSARAAVDSPMAVVGDAPPEGGRRRGVVLMPLGLMVIAVAEILRRTVGLDAAVIALAVGCVTAMMGVVTGASTLSRAAARTCARSAQVPILLAARSVEARPRHAARVAGGLALMVFSSGLLLSYLPLLSDGALPGLREYQEAVGGSSLIVPASASAQEVASVRAAGHAQAVAEFHQVFTADGEALVYVSCPDLRALLGSAPGDGCSDVVRDQITALQFGVGADSSGLPTRLVTDSEVPPAVRADAQAVHWIIAKPVGGIEPLRTDLLAATGRETLTSDEMVAQASLTTRTFRAVLVAAVVASAIVALTSLLVALADHVDSQRRSRQMLRVAGVSRRSMRRSLVVQAMLATAPAIVAAYLLGLAATAVFTGLRDAGLAQVPWLEGAATLGAALVLPMVASTLAFRLLDGSALVHSE